MTSNNPTVERLEDQITWYDNKSVANQRWHKTLKVTEIIAAAMIPLAAGFGASAILTGGLSAILTGGLGVCIVVLEGLQGLNQYQQNWITYRSTCEELKHEKYLWLAKAGPYANAQSPDVTLAERVESLISREHAKWVSVREHNEQEQKKTVS